MLRYSAFIIATANAMAAAAPNQTDANQVARDSLRTVLMMLAGLAMMWVIVIRPQSKKTAEQAALLKKLKTNDRVVTSSGILGTVVTLRDDSVTLRTGGNTIEVTKSSISQVLDKPA